jgi:hypothetical protein
MKTCNRMYRSFSERFSMSHPPTQWKAGLMKPWIALETLKLLFFLGFGIALIAMAPQWARELGQFIANVASNSGYAVNATEEYLRMQLIAQGAGLIIATLIGAYFLFVVISHHNNVKDGVGADDQVKPMPHM